MANTYTSLPKNLHFPTKKNAFLIVVPDTCGTAIEVERPRKPVCKLPEWQKGKVGMKRDGGGAKAVVGGSAKETFEIRLEAGARRVLEDAVARLSAALIEMTMWTSADGSGWALALETAEDVAAVRELQDGQWPAEPGMRLIDGSLLRRGTLVPMGAINRHLAEEPAEGPNASRTTSASPELREVGERDRLGRVAHYAFLLQRGPGVAGRWEDISEEYRDVWRRIAEAVVQAAERDR